MSDKHLEALPSPSPDEPEAVTGARDFLLELITNPGENDDEGMDAREALDAEGLLFGDLPVIILSGADTKEEWLSDLTPELRDEFWSIWLDDQKRLAAESTRGEWRVVEGSAHEIHRAQLKAVVDAIDEVVDQAK